MGDNNIGMVAAMPDEIRPLLQRIGTCSKGRLEGRNRFDFEIGKNTVTLVESGMGPERAGAATRALIEAVSPRLIVNFGFTGAVTSDITEGELVLAREVWL